MKYQALNQSEEDRRRSNASFYIHLLTFVVFVACVAVILVFLYFYFKRPVSLADDPNALFDEQNRYILHNFDVLKPMSNFLAGVGGFWGKPMWVFYVNRGQGVTSFGIRNKDNPIAKFHTANIAYQVTPFLGFRTFLKLNRGGKISNHMPFFPKVGESKSDPTRNMMVGLNEMEIEENYPEENLKTNILYFTAPNEDFASMIRRTTFTNTDFHKDLEIDVLDGLARIVPSGLGDYDIDSMGRLREAWMRVYNKEEDGKFLEPFYHISQGLADTATVTTINDGHFFVSYLEGEDAPLELDGTYSPLPFIVDPSVVFGMLDTDLTHPKIFFGENSDIGMDIEELIAQPQAAYARTPCAFAAVRIRIPPNSNVTITTVIGHADNLDQFKSKISPIVRKPGFVASKRFETADFVKKITDKVATTTSSSLLNGYIRQDFLDNCLRGGVPVLLGNPNEPKVFHTFSRIHGDLERDYNNFQIDPTYFSQGPGNFRDVTQNRRVDVSLVPEVFDFNVRQFLSFIQADGYNPLTVATANFNVPQEKIENLTSHVCCIADDRRPTLGDALRNPFRVGDLFAFLASAGVTFESTAHKEKFINEIVAEADQTAAGLFAQNAFWADHWTYILDLVKNFISIFPDQEEYLLYDSVKVPFFMSPAVVRSRKDKYQLVTDQFDKTKKNVRIVNAIAMEGDYCYPAGRTAEIAEIKKSPTYVQDSTGAGGVWQRDSSGETFAVSVIAKLTMLGVLKFAALDPQGMGVEMEGGKPGWNDAMNGLPGLLGSGMPETFEMLMVLRYVIDVTAKYQRGFDVPEEFDLLFRTVFDAVEKYSKSSDDDKDFKFWDHINKAREVYRSQVAVSFLGTMVALEYDDVLEKLKSMEQKTELGIQKALDLTDGFPPTYFYYEATDYDIIDGAIYIKKFQTHTLPLFLEGPTRYLKTISDASLRYGVYNHTKNSPLYDANLKMYTISQSLKGMSQEIGRMMAFSPGWLENQSVWLHMSYKYYLELLRAGLYEEFFAEILTGIVPFMDNKVYGRSPLEASSFIVSSAFPDKNLHGGGYLARLTGSTAEFLSIWTHMMAGPNPFRVDDDGKVVLDFNPIIPSWLFTEPENIVSFVFLGKVTVTYHNPKRLDTWIARPVAIIVNGKDDSLHEFTASQNDDSKLIIDTDVAHMIRNGEAKSVDIYY